MTPEVVRTQNFVDETAQAIVAILQRALQRGGYCVLGLSGGSTPRSIYERLATIEGIPWNRIVITFGDERCVPPDHPDSNYAMARAALLGRVALPAENVLRMKGELDPHEAALEYEQQLTDAAVRFGLGDFTHDLLLLGLGDDGHTASLFPDTAALNVTDRRVIENYVPKVSAYRLTLTLPFINASKAVLFMLSGPKKQEIVRQILDGTHEYPAGLVRPTDGTVTWYMGA